MKKNNKLSHELTLRHRLWQYRESYLLMAPYMILFFLLTVIPVLASIFLSLTDFNMLSMPGFVGFENYLRLFLDDKTFLIVLKNTLIFAFITGPIGYMLSFLCAWLINELGPRMRTFMTLLFYMPVLSGTVYTIWGFLFSGDSYGIINSVCLQLGIIDKPQAWMLDQNTVLPVLIVVQLWLSLGTGFLAFIAGFQNADKSLFEAGAIDGISNRWQELIYITIPSMSQQLLFSAVMQIGASFGVSTVITVLAGFPTTLYSADTIVTYIMDVGTTRFEMGYASTIAVFLFALMMISNHLIQGVLRRFGTED